MMSNCPQCDESLKKIHDAGSPWNICTDPNACDETNYMIHSFCNCTGMFSVHPYVQNGQCINGPGTLVPNAKYECYCCCSCYGYSMRVAVTHTTAKSIQDLNVDDTVLVAKDASLKTWTEEPVSFSSGTGADAINSFINIHFGDQKSGMHISSGYFVSELITPGQADAYYRILSTAPNDFIGEDGLVNMAMVQQSNELVLSELLGVSIQVASWIFAILKLDTNYLMVSRVQPLLMRDGTLKQAEKLVPGKDVLVCKDGSTTPLISVEISQLEKGVHYIATSLEQATSLDGHLLLSNGIVIGDYATLMAMNTPGNPLEDKYKNDPALGTKEYGAENSRLLITPTGAYVKSQRPTDDPTKKSQA